MTNLNDNKTIISTPEEKETDVVMKRLDAIEDGLKVELEESRAEVKELSDKLNNLPKSNNSELDDGIVDIERKSAHIMSLPVIEGAPVIKSVISSVLGIEGVELMAEIKNARGEKYTLPFGCNIKKVDFSKDNLKDVYHTSYETLKTQKFNLVDIDQNDLTGASKIEHNVVVEVGQPVNEVDRSTGTPIATGRKVRANVKRNLREYTIEFEGKNFKLTEADLANIRI